MRRDIFLFHFEPFLANKIPPCKKQSGWSSLNKAKLAVLIQYIRTLQPRLEMFIQSSLTAMLNGLVKSGDRTPVAKDNMALYSKNVKYDSFLSNKPLLALYFFYC